MLVGCAAAAAAVAEPHLIISQPRATPATFLYYQIRSLTPLHWRMASSATAAAMSHNLQALSLTRPSLQQCRRSVISCGVASRVANVGSSTAAFPRRELLGASVKGLGLSLTAVSRVSCVLEGAPRQLEGDEGMVAPPSKIWLSDVVVKRRRNYFKNRQWTSKDLMYAGFMIFMHGLCLFAPATFSWNAFGVFMGLYVITGMLGITLSYHRHLSHKSFKVPKWLEYTFAYCGVQAVQVLRMCFFDPFTKSISYSDFCQLNQNLLQETLFE